MISNALARARHRNRVIWTFLFVVAGLFCVTWLIINPIILAYNEGWTYAAAFYFTTQAGLGIGYGALAPSTDLAKGFMVLHVVFGSLVVAGLIAYFLDTVLEKADAAAAKRANGASIDLGEGAILGAIVREWASFGVGLALLFLSLLAGVLYGTLYERWSFVTSLLFITSTCQTSGLIAPTINARSDAWPTVFVAALDLVSVPVWAYVIGKVAHLIASAMSSQRHILNAFEREKKAEAAFARRCVQIRNRNDAGKDGEGGKSGEGGKTPPTTQHLDRASFLELWLLRNDLVSEATLASIEDEFDALHALRVPNRPNGPTGTVALWKVRARLHFEQLVGLGLAKPGAWEASIHAAAVGTSGGPLSESDEIDYAALERSSMYLRQGVHRGGTFKEVYIPASERAGEV